MVIKSIFPLVALKKIIQILILSLYGRLPTLANPVELGTSFPVRKS